MPRGNTENLTFNTDRTPEEIQENARKAGKASAEARRKKRSLRQALKFLQEQEIGIAWANDPRAKMIMQRAGLDERDCTAMLTAASIISEAVDGNAQMAKIVVDLTADEGKKPAPARIVLQFEDNSEEFEV